MPFIRDPPIGSKINHQLAKHSPLLQIHPDPQQGSVNIHSKIFKNWGLFLQNWPTKTHLISLFLKKKSSREKNNQLSAQYVQSLIWDRRTEKIWQSNIWVYAVFYDISHTKNTIRDGVEVAPNSPFPPSLADRLKQLNSPCLFDCYDY